jgi:hypothetical protein
MFLKESNWARKISSVSKEKKPYYQYSLDGIAAFPFLSKVSSVASARIIFVKLPTKSKF